MNASPNALETQRAAYAPVVPGVDELDVWGPDEFMRAHGTLQASFARARHVAGVLLWGARRALDDGAYGDHVRAVAALYDVEPDTLYRWRSAAEKADSLPPADERSAARRAALAPPAACGKESDENPTPAGPAPERVTPTEVIPPAAQLPEGSSVPPVPPARHEQPTLPGADAWGRVAAMSVTELAARPIEELKAMQRKIAEAIRVARL